MWSIYLILTHFFLCEGANILILHPVYAGSHEFILRALGDLLVSRGHQVTQVRFKHTNAHKKLETGVKVVTLDIEDALGNCGRYVSKEGQIDITKVGAKILWNEGHHVSGLPTDIFCLTDCHCHNLFNSDTIKRVLNETKFDLAIVDLIASECSVALAASLKVPMVGFWGFTFHGGQVAYTSIFNPPSVQPMFFSGLNKRMDFFSRVHNVMLHIFHRLYVEFQSYYASHYIRRQFPQLPSVDRLIHDMDLFLVNSNEFLEYPKLLPPNVKYIGGVHIPPQVPSLPKEYEKFMSEAEHGVLLFSLGYTGFSAKDVPREVIDNLLGIFASLDQRVIMRFDAQYLPFIPKNVMVSDWVPQLSILGHPKTVAFFTHCGISGLLEAVHNGVPLIAAGIFADQVDNAAMMEDLGVAVRLDKNDLTKFERVKTAVEEVLTNDTYRVKSHQLSRMWKDRPLTAAAEATYWIEALLKYRNLHHLRIEDHDLTFWQYFCVDVFLFLMCLPIFSMVAFICLLKKMNRGLRVVKEKAD